ncbi:MAG: gas vesicle protein GvpN [Phycisphaerae bacterium]|nr:gas vesicle protein GvpN [Phycisphaerae bacterium]
MPATDGVTPIEIEKDQPGVVRTPMVDSIVNRSLAYLGAGYPVHLTGAAGTGKTCLALYIAAQIGRPIILTHGDEELGTTDMVGGSYGWKHKKVMDNFIHSVKKLDQSVSSMWVDNRVTVACKYGFTLVYDEFTRSRAEANNSLLSVLEERVLDMPSGRGDQSFVRVHPNFHAIFTSNPAEYAGVHRAADALLDRMVTIKLGHYDRETEIAITVAKAGVSDTTATRIVDIVRGLRDSELTDRRGDEVCPATVRASIIIATVLQAYEAEAKVNDANFVLLCHDVLDSSRMEIMPDQNVKDEVTKLIQKFAA